MNLSALLTGKSQPISIDVTIKITPIKGKTGKIQSITVSPTITSAKGANVSMESVDQSNKSSETIERDDDPSNQSDTTKSVYSSILEKLNSSGTGQVKQPSDDLDRIKLKRSRSFDDSMVEHGGFLKRLWRATENKTVQGKEDMESDDTDRSIGSKDNVGIEKIKRSMSFTKDTGQGQSFFEKFLNTKKQEPIPVTQPNVPTSSSSKQQTQASSSFFDRLLMVGAEPKAIEPKNIKVKPELAKLDLNSDSLSNNSASLPLWMRALVSPVKEQQAPMKENEDEAKDKKEDIVKPPQNPNKQLPNWVNALISPLQTSNLVLINNYEADEEIPEN